MAEVIYLTGIEQARRCWEAAKGTESEVERDAWMRMSARYMRRVSKMAVPETGISERPVARRARKA